MRQLNGSVSVDEEVRVCSPTNVPQKKSRSRFNSVEYASYAPDAPQVYIDDAQFRGLWLQPERRYLLARQAEWPRFERSVGREPLSVVAVSGGKFLVTNHPFGGTARTQPLAGLRPSFFSTQSHGRVESKDSVFSLLTLSPMVFTGIAGLAEWHSSTD